MARKTTPCPCGGGDYAACCGRWHAGAAAPDAETLMRSRYSAYVLGDTAYLLATWHPETRPATLDLDAEVRPKWLGLTVLRHEARDARQAIVEFVARYKIGGRAHRMHETSRFTRAQDRWFYLDGEVDAP
jgi:SEC-C motif-containing protein